MPTNPIFDSPLSPEWRGDDTSRLTQVVLSGTNEYWGKVKGTSVIYYVRTPGDFRVRQVGESDPDLPPAVKQLAEALKYKGP